MKFERSSGLLLHPTSLPGPYGIGDIGPQAHRWVDFLADSGSVEGAIKAFVDAVGDGTFPAAEHCF